MALASVTQAMLIPPSISPTDIDNNVVNTLPFEHEAEADDRLLLVECKSCPVVVADLVGNLHNLDKPSKLQFNLGIQHGQGLDILTLNAVQIYPMAFDLDSLFQQLTAPEIVDLGDDNWQQVSEPNLGFNLQVGHVAQDSQDEELGLVSIKLDIFQVADAFLHDFPTIEIKLLETQSGKLMIGDVEIVPQPAQVDQPHDSECTNFLCKWRAIVTEKLDSLKGHGCGRKADNMSGPRPDRQGHGPHHFHRHRHNPQLARFLRTLTIHVLIPILIGIMAGVTASLVGMIVGHLIVLIWRVFFRRNSNKANRKCRPSKSQQDDFENLDEKILVAYEDGPPKYEELSDEEEVPLLVEEIVVEKGSEEK